MKELGLPARDYGDADTHKIIAQFQTDMESGKQKLEVEEGRVAELVAQNDQLRNAKRALEEKRATLKSVLAGIKDETYRLNEKICVDEQITNDFKDRVSIEQQKKDESTTACVESEHILEDCKQSYYTRTFGVIERIYDLIENHQPSKIEEEKRRLHEEKKHLQEELHRIRVEEQRLIREQEAMLLSTQHVDTEATNESFSLQDIEKLSDETRHLAKCLEDAQVQNAAEREALTSSRSSRKKTLLDLRSEGESLEKVYEDLYFRLCSTKSAISTSYCKCCRALLLH